MSVLTEASWSRVDDDVTSAARLVGEVRLLGDDAIREEVAIRRSHSSAQQAADRETRRLARAESSVARLHEAL